MRSRKGFLCSQSPRRAAAWLLSAAFSMGVPDISVTAATGAAPPKERTFSTEVKKLVDDAQRAQTFGELGLALVQLKNAVRLSPRNGEIRAYLGVALLKSGDTRIAERELRDAWKANAPDDVVIPALLDAMIARGEVRELLDEFPEPLSARHAKFAPDILRQRALALQILGRDAEATETMERSLKLRRDARGLTARAKLAAEDGDLALTQRLIDEALKIAPREQEVLASSVALYFERGDLDKALAAADDFVRRAPLSTIGRVIRIEVLLARKEDALAQAELDALLTVSPDSSFGPYYGGVLAARANNFQDAWHQEQTLQPEFVLSRPGITMMVAEIAIGSGNVETGAAILAALISRRPDFELGRIRLAGIMLRLRSPEVSVKLLEPIKAKDDPQVQAILGQAYSQLGRYNDAVGALEKAISTNKDGNIDNLKQQRAVSLYELGGSDQALSDLRDLGAKQPGDWGRALTLIGSLVQAKKFAEALTVLDRMPKTALSDAVGSTFYRGRVLAVQGDLRGAEAAFTETLRLDPKFILALYFRGHVRVGRGNAEGGKSDFRQMLMLDPNNFHADLALAQIAIHDGKDAETRTLLQAAMTAGPREIAPRMALATFQMSHREFENAQSTLDDLLKLYPANPDVLRQIGQVQFMSGKPDRAVETFRQLAATYIYSPGAYVLLAKALNTVKDRLAAIDAVRRAVELAPYSSQVRLLLIEYQIAAGRSAQAEEGAREYVKSNPGPEADTLLGSTLFKLGKATEANSYLNARFAAKPDRLIALQLAQNAASVRDSKKAAAILADWLRKNSGDSETRRTYAALLMQAGDLAGARTQFESLLKDAPEDPAILNDLSWCLQREDPDRAYALASLAAKIVPNSKEVMDTLGWLKYQRRDLQGALLLIRRAHDLNASDGETGYHYAVVLDAAGRRAEAKALLQGIVAKDTDFAAKSDAKKLLARW